MQARYIYITMHPRMYMQIEHTHIYIAICLRMPLLFDPKYCGVQLKARRSGTKGLTQADDSLLGFCMLSQYVEKVHVRSNLIPQSEGVVTTSICLRSLIFAPALEQAFPDVSANLKGPI